MSGLEGIIRPFQSPEQSQGYRPNPTKGVNSDPAVLEIGEGDNAARDPAVVRNDQVIDMNRWPVLNAAHGATEDVVLDRSVAGSFFVDMTVSGILLLRATGSSLSLSFGSLPALPEEQQRSMWYSRTRAITVQITVNWLSSASSRSVALSGVRFSEGVPPTWSKTADSYDTVLVQKFSNGLLLGFQPGKDQKVPT
jgi:hypothetical protein